MQLALTLLADITVLVRKDFLDVSVKYEGCVQGRSVVFPFRYAQEGGSRAPRGVLGKCFCLTCVYGRYAAGVSVIINCKLFVIYFYSILFRTWPSWELVRPTTLIGKMHYPWFLTQKIRPSLSVTRQICTPVSPTIITLLHYGEITSAVIINIIG